MMGISFSTGFNAAAAGLALLLVARLPQSATAQTKEPAAQGSEGDWTATVLEEDDFWAPNDRDRHYTHGIRFSGTSGEVEGIWEQPFQWLSGLTPAFPNADDASRRYNLILLGQNMYTPENFQLFNPDPHDRPYAGWLYSGVSMMQDTKGTQDNIDRFDELALKLGIVGPGSLAHFTQTRYHLLIHVEPFQGWHAQLHNEPTLDLFYQRKWRFHGESSGGWGWDTIPQWDARAGNVYDYLGAGGLVRLGRNLRADYGPPHIDLNTGADYINESRYTDGDWGLYAFMGGEGRAVAHNIFLDGNDFKSSAHVTKIPAVADLVAGLAVFYGHTRLAYTYVYRTREFLHQNAPDHYGALDLTIHLAF